MLSLKVSLDGASFADYRGPIALTEGMHEVEMKAEDAAGNVTEGRLAGANAHRLARTGGEDRTDGKSAKTARAGGGLSMLESLHAI